MMRQILHAHRDGKYAALDNPQAVVVDYEARAIRIGLKEHPIPGRRAFRLMAFLLRSADLLQTYRAVVEAVGGNASVGCLRTSIVPTIDALGMTIETVKGVGYRLHTEPRKTLECCKALAPGQPVPSRVRSTPVARKRKRSTFESSPSRLIRFSPL